MDRKVGCNEEKFSEERGVSKEVLLASVLLMHFEIIAKYYDHGGILEHFIEKYDNLFNDQNEGVRYLKEIFLSRNISKIERLLDDSNFCAFLNSVEIILNGSEQYLEMDTLTRLRMYFGEFFVSLVVKREGGGLITFRKPNGIPLYIYENADKFVLYYPKPEFYNRGEFSMLFERNEKVGIICSDRNSLPGILDTQHYCLDINKFHPVYTKEMQNALITPCSLRLKDFQKNAELFFPQAQCSEKDQFLKCENPSACFCMECNNRVLCFDHIHKHLQKRDHRLEAIVYFAHKLNKEEEVEIKNAKILIRSYVELEIRRKGFKTAELLNSNTTKYSDKRIKEYSDKIIKEDSEYKEDVINNQGTLIRILDLLMTNFSADSQEPLIRYIFHQRMYRNKITAELLLDCISEFCNNPYRESMRTLNSYPKRDPSPLKIKDDDSLIDKRINHLRIEYDTSEIKRKNSMHQDDSWVPPLRNKVKTFFFSQ